MYEFGISGIETTLINLYLTLTQLTFNTAVQNVFTNAIDKRRKDNLRHAVTIDIEKIRELRQWIGFCLAISS